MRFNKEEKAMWLEDWQQSGKSAWAYAHENGICPQTFARWTKTGTEVKHELVEIPKAVIAATKQEPEILIEKGDVKIHIPLESVRGELHAVIKVLGQSL
jgi:transposase-like protein